GVMKHHGYRMESTLLFLWKECDGRNNVHKISIELVKEFGDEIEPVYERIKIFFNMLKNLKAIELN
ncbi:PqqD family protein, partial [Candidatus Marinimicrobia bacterium MT.SAG.2]